MYDFLVGFKTGIKRIFTYNNKEYEVRYDEVLDIFHLMDSHEDPT